VLLISLRERREPADRARCTAVAASSRSVRRSARRACGSCARTLTESVLLYVAGCGGGLLAANWTLDLIVALMPGYMPQLNDIRMNGRVLAATFAIACAAGLVAGLLPALQGASPRLVEDLRASAGNDEACPRRGRATSLVVAQIALSLVLLVGATLMIRTFLILRPDQPGFTTSDKFTASVRLQGPRAAAPAAFFDALFERLRRLPGVEGVTGSTYLPVSGNVGIATIRGGETPLEVLSGIVMPDYFAEMQIPLVGGRRFDTRDTAGALPVAIVNGGIRAAPRRAGRRRRRVARRHRHRPED
jgi:hypothetical protein